MKRRSETPITILIIGIVAVVALGMGVVKYTSQTPVLQLPGALQERWGYKGASARFKKGEPPWVEVDLPAGETPDALRLVEVGAFALDRYVQLAPKTRAGSVVVRVKGRQDLAPVTVTLAQATQMREAPAGLQAVRSLALRQGATEADVQLLGLSATGVELRVTGRAKREDAAERTAAAVSSLTWVGRVEVEFVGESGPVRATGGRDAKLRSTGPRPPTDPRGQPPTGRQPR